MKLKIKFTNKEMVWMERTADIESSLLIKEFLRIIAIDLKEKTEMEKEMLKKIGTELIESFVFLKELRTKLELRDCRYDVNTEIEMRVEDK